MHLAPPNPFDGHLGAPNPNAFWAWFLSWANPQYGNADLHEAAMGYFLEWYRQCYGLPEALHPEDFEWLGGPYRKLFKVDLAFEALIKREPHLFLLDADTHRGGPHPHLLERAEIAQGRYQNHRVIAIDHAMGLLPGEKGPESPRLLIRIGPTECVWGLQCARLERGAHHGLVLAYESHLKARIFEEAQWHTDFFAQPDWHWLTILLENQPDLFHLEAQPEGAELWRQGMHREAYERASSRAASLQWALMQQLVERLCARQVPGHRFLALSRNTHVGPPWTKLHVWEGAIGPPESTLYYRLGRERHGLVLSLKYPRVPGYHSPARFQLWAESHRVLVEAWQTAANQVGLSSLFQPGKENEIARLALQQQHPNPTAQDLEKLLDEVALVHHAFLAPAAFDAPPP